MNNSLTQLESNPVYEVQYRYIDPYDRTVRIDNAADIVATVIGTMLALCIWLMIMWRLPSKAGYRGASRWVWFATMGFPLTTAWSLLVFILLPWPIQKELKKTRNQQPSKPSPNPIDDIEAELQQMRRQM